VAVSVLYLVTSLATETVTNNAAAIILTPVALSMAAELGVDARLTPGYYRPSAPRRSPRTDDRDHPLARCLA